MLELNLMKEIFSVVPALSCVEYYFLAYRQFKNMDNRLLYAESYVPFGKLINEFSSGEGYENYTGIKRLQDFSEENGFSRHDILTDLNINFSGELLLMQVNEKYLSNMRNRPLRDDHYVMILNDGNKALLCDYYPFKITETFDIKEFFGGNYLAYSFLNGNRINLLRKGILQVQNFLMTNNEYTVNCYFSAGKFMNALGIYKIILRRLRGSLTLLEENGFIESFGDADMLFEELIRFVDKAFTVASYSVLRGRSFDAAGDCAHRINRIENDLKNSYRLLNI